MKNKKTTWILWSVLTVAIIIYFGYRITSDDKKIFVPGEMTHGHHQIEMACNQCHTDEFGGGEVLQKSCVNCHAEELKIIDDSHPKSKFTNPRNASRVKELDARVCVSCHTEHQNEITGEMGVTLPEDFCFKCHQDVAENRPSHKGMKFTTCASAGCHNYHDNSSLYEDFLEKHIGESDLLAEPVNKTKSETKSIALLSRYPVTQYPVKKLTATDMDGKADVHNDNNVTYEWEMTGHAQSGVNCTACHQQKTESGKNVWLEKPTEQSCKSCHTEAVKGFLEGKHGMRIKAGLSPMTPAEAKQPMRANLHTKELSCVSCHGAHKFDVKQAAVEACLGCHDDAHSKAYKKSPHFVTLHKEISGQAKKESGVSCATCHMPAVVKESDEHELVLTEHNQNLNLRPNEKMIRGVCMNCHGLGFSIDSLADKNLINNNFNGMPSVHVESIDMVKDRLSKRKKPGEGG